MIGPRRARTVPLAALLAALALPGAALAGAGVSATLTPEAPYLEGECPREVQFTGTLTVTDPAIKEVRFQFVRSDGVGAPVETLSFPAPATTRLSIVMPVGGDTIGWMGIEVLTPAAGILAKAHVEVKCSNIPVSWYPILKVDEDLTIREDCVPCRSSSIAAAERDGRWVLTANGKVLRGFPSRAEAQGAQKALSRFKGTHACAVGPGLIYLLNGGHPVRGEGKGEESVLFDPEKVKVRKTGSGWALLEGDRPLFAFGPDEVGARKALAIIRHYRFDRACRLAGDQGPYWYLRK